MNVLKPIRICECPLEEPKIEKPSEKPTQKPTEDPLEKSSPMDSFGFKGKCCGCVPLKSAVIVIGIVTLIWAAVHLQAADKSASNIFCERKILFKCLKLICIVAAILLLLSCGILFLGIVMNTSDLINIFVWYGFIYNCLSIALVATVFVLKVLTTEKKILKHVIRLIVSLSWNCLFLYLLTIVNSYKILTIF